MICFYEATDKPIELSRGKIDRCIESSPSFNKECLIICVKLCMVISSLFFEEKTPSLL